MSNVIKILKPDDYRSFKGWVTDVKSVNPVFVSSFKHPQEHKPIDMYAKIYSLSGSDRSVFNEILGYLMIDAIGLPQPKYACIALVPTKNISENIKEGDLHETLRREVFQRDVFPMFCTSKIDKSQTALQFHGKVDAVASELAKWKYLGDVVAADNTIANIDRHVGNLLRTGSNQYHLIDNGILVNHNGWQQSHLSVNSNFDNKLLRLSDSYLNLKQCTQMKSAAILACDRHDNAFTYAYQELIYWVQTLYKAVQNDYNKFIDFLAYRANNAHGLLTSRFQMVI